MKYTLLICSYFAALSLIGQEVVNGPKLAFFQDELDYGLIKQGSDGRRTFIFKNTGNEPLLISSCRGSCGCTVAVCPTDVVLPGKANKVDVVYDTQRLGAFNKTITVVSNAVNFPTFLLHIKGFVDGANSVPLQMTVPAFNVRQQR